MSTVSGACVKRARFAAALGKPMPTNKEVPLRTMRAAAMVIISSEVYSSVDGRVACGVECDSVILRCLLQQQPELIEIRGVHDVLVDPGKERAAVLGDFVPLLIESVAARIVPMRVRGKRPALGYGHRA